MKIVPLGEVKNQFSEYLERAEKEPIFVTRNGRITAVIEHITDEEIEDYLLERSPRFRRMLHRVKKQTGAKTLEAVRKQLRI